MRSDGQRRPRRQVFAVQGRNRVEVRDRPTRSHRAGSPFNARQGSVSRLPGEAVRCGADLSDHQVDLRGEVLIGRLGANQALQGFCVQLAARDPTPPRQALGSPEEGIGNGNRRRRPPELGPVPCSYASAQEKKAVCGPEEQKKRQERNPNRRLTTPVARRRPPLAYRGSARAFRPVTFDGQPRCRKKAVDVGLRVEDEREQQGTLPGLIDGHDEWNVGQ